MIFKLKALQTVLIRHTVSRDYSHFTLNLHKTSRLYRVFDKKLINYVDVSCFSVKLSKSCYSSGPCFSLSDYDCIGFDLDNTICEHNLDHSVRHEYDVLAKFLVQEKGHDENFLLKPLLDPDIDFIQKGLIVDTGKGILLRIRKDGFIFKAAHGTKLLNEDEIKRFYGNDRKWYVTTEFAADPVTTWNGPLSEKMRTFSDYFDMPAALALARCVDSKLTKPGYKIDYYGIWNDVKSGLENMYNKNQFSLNLGGYFRELKTNPNRYYKKCRPEVLKLLKELKSSKLTFLITGSNVDYASLTASKCLGNDWRSYFHVVVSYSKKPGFFVGNRPFIGLDGFNETGPIGNDEIQIGGIYNQGNWEGLYKLLCKSTGKDNPKCLYIGDNLIQDVFTASEYTHCDTLAINEELSAEFLNHPFKDILASNTWGSYFSFDNCNTLWGDIIQKHSKICIPCLDVLASKALDYKFSTFSENSTGYHSLSGPLDLNSLKKK